MTAILLKSLRCAAPERREVLIHSSACERQGEGLKAYGNALTSLLHHPDFSATP